MYGAQKQLIREQDDNLNEINQIAERLQCHAKNIQLEIENQDTLLQDLDQNLDKTKGRMDYVQKKLQVLLKTQGSLSQLNIDNSQICTIMLLFGILVFLIFLVLYT